MTYRFLIVDDEYYVRQHIHHCIDWESLGFQYAGEAGNVSSALEFLQKNPVELLLLDISMPGQSGLDLLKSLSPDKIPHTIILTGFATFDYAKDPIKYGVDNYLLKPVNSAELMEAAAAIKQQLDKENTFLKERQEMLDRSQIIEKDMQNKFFRELFSGYIPDSANTLLLTYHIFPEKPYYLLILDVCSDTESDPSYEQRNSWRKAIENIIEKFFTDKPFCLLTQDSYNRTILLLETPLSDISIHLEVKQMKSQVFDNYGLRLLSGYSQCLTGTAEELCRCYHRALEFFQIRSIYSFDVALPQTKLPDIEFLDVINVKNSQIKTCLFNRQKIELTETLHTVFQTMEENIFSIQALEAELFSLMSIAIHYCAVKRLDILETEESSVSYNCSEMIRSGLPCQQMELRFSLLFQTLIDSNADEDGQFIETLVLQAVDLINKNYSQEDLGLNTIAAQLLISPSYLSRNFTKIQGISLTSYLTKCRLENARRLLANTSLSIAEISEKSGYRDLFYFSKRFKNAFGISPSRYRADQERMKNK